MMNMELLGRGKRKPEFHGCSEGRYAKGRCDRGGYGGQGEMEGNDLLWQPLKAVAGKKGAAYKNEVKLKQP